MEHRCNYWNCNCRCLYNITDLVYRQVCTCTRTFGHVVLIKCWRIYCGDVFLGYEYSDDSNGAILRSLAKGGVASQYGVKVTELEARSV